MAVGSLHSHLVNAPSDDVQLWCKFTPIRTKRNSLFFVCLSILFENQVLVIANLRLLAAVLPCFSPCGLNMEFCRAGALSMEK